MGLLLRHPTSFTSLTSRAFSPGGPTVPDSGSDLDPSEPSCHSYRHDHLRSLHRRSRRSLSLSSQSSLNRTRPQQHRKPARLRSSHLGRHRQAAIRPAVAQTHHVKPHNPWAADADEGRALARSDILLPDEHTQQHPQSDHEGYEHDLHRRSSGSRSRSSSSSSSGSDGRQRRPPSLERQDAFRDEKTVKRRRYSYDEPSSSLMRSSAVSYQSAGDDEKHLGGMEEQDAREIAELYRMGLLYDDEHERGEGFSLGQIVREEPLYSVRVSPAARQARKQAESVDFGPSLAVDLAFSAFAEDEALAGWMVSSSSFAPQGIRPEECCTLWQGVVHDTPPLTVIYELADDAVSAVSSGDFLESVSVSEVSDCTEEEEDEVAWAILGGCYGDKNEASATTAASVVEADEDEVDPWVVLGHDGS